jgi:hypothetical protein
MNLNFSELERNTKDNIFIYDDVKNDTKITNVKIIDTNQERSNLYYNPLENKLQQQNSIFNATIQPKQKPKLSYDDMLNSMNVTVVNGVLRFGVDSEKLKNMQNNSYNTDYINEPKYDMEYKTLPKNDNTRKHVSIKQENLNYHQANNNNNKSYSNEPLDPNVKNSWIYNKYFKNYKEDQQNISEERPLTKKEFDEKIIKEFLERRRAQKIAGQVKSTKLLFSNNNQIIYSSQNNNNLNKLFKFK